MKMIKSFKIIKIFMKNQMQDRTYLLLDIFNMFSRCFIVFLLYGYVFSLNNGSINGTDYITTFWSMFIYFCMMTFSIRKIINVIMRDVKSGNAEMFLNKPINYVILNCYKAIGKGIYSFLLISFIGTILMLIFIGFPKINILFFVPNIIVTVILGVILSLLLYSCIGLLSFFMQDVRPIYWIVDKLVMILGGSYLPISMFPAIMKKIAYITPLGAINFASSTVYNNSYLEYLSRIFTQLFWILVFFLLLRFIYKKVRLKVMINGG